MECNVCLNEWVHNQGGSGSAGGCSTYRTPEIQAEAAHKLHEHHRPFVKVVKKTTKTAWGGGERTDVIVQWKKAYKISITEQDKWSIVKRWIQVITYNNSIGRVMFVNVVV